MDNSLLEPPPTFRRPDEQESTTPIFAGDLVRVAELNIINQQDQQYSQVPSSLNVELTGPVRSWSNYELEGQESQDPYGDMHSFNFDNLELELGMDGYANNNHNSQSQGLPDSISTQFEEELLAMGDIDAGVLANSSFDSHLLNSLPSQAQTQQEKETVDSRTEDTVTFDKLMLQNENVCLDSHLGDVNFQVLPKMIQSQKMAHWNEENKFYCDTGTYEFCIKMDYNKIHKIDQYSVRLTVVFTDPEFQDTPTKRCINCSETQKIMDGGGTHIIRGHLEDKFSRCITSHETDRDYVIIALRSPELGSDVVTQKLTFTCRNSCKSTVGRGLSRRSTAMIFTLLNEKQNIIARAVLNLRICSAPQRDFRTDKKKYEKENMLPEKQSALLGTRQLTSETKLSTISEQPETDGTHIPKKRKMRDAVDNHDHPQPKVIKKEWPDKVKLEDGAIQTMKEEDPCGVSSSQDCSDGSSGSSSVDCSSSQESNCSTFEMNIDRSSILKLSNLIKDSRRILTWRHSQHIDKREASQRLFECLQLAHNLCSQYRGLLETESDIEVSDPTKKKKKKKKYCKNCKKLYKTKSGNPAAC